MVVPWAFLQVNRLTIIPPFPSVEPAAHGQTLADPDRLAALSSTGLMDSMPEEAFDRVVRLATQLTGVPVGLFSLVDTRRQYFKARAGLEEIEPSLCETELSSSLCQYVVSQDQPMAVSDSRTHELLAPNGAVQGLGVVAYLGTPIHAPNGQAIGSLCAIDLVPREWSEAQLATLRDLAAIIEAELKLRQGMAERAMITAELNHRIKNLFAIVSAMVRMSHRQHDDAGDMAADLEARVNALARAHQLIVPSQLNDLGLTGGLALEDLLKVVLAPYLVDGGQRQLSLGGPPVALGGRATTSLALAFHELATNSMKYGVFGTPGARLQLEWQQRDGVLHLSWSELANEMRLVTGKGGFGSQLLEMTIEGQLQGSFSTDVIEAGLQHRIAVPLDMLAQ